MSTTFDPRPFLKVDKKKIYKVAHARKVTDAQLDAFFAQVRKAPRHCWLWTGEKRFFTKDGLPLFPTCPPGPARLDVTVPTAHRTSYAWFRGMLLPYRGADGLPLSKLVQLCGNRACVNPAHLKQVRIKDKDVVPKTAAHEGLILSQITYEEDGFRVAPADAPTACWRWRGKVNAQGYPYVDLPGLGRRAVDEITFDWFVGYPIGKSWIDYQLYHRCRHKACVNPKHFELVPFGRRKLMDRPGYVESPQLDAALTEKGV